VGQSGKWKLGRYGTVLMIMELKEEEHSRWNSPDEEKKTLPRKKT
jgi:hypothetical protein